MKKEIIQTLKIVTLGLIVSAGFAFANTWNTKPVNPVAPALPSSNVSIPIDVGSYSQLKKGTLGVGPLVVAGESQMTGNINIEGPDINNPSSYPYPANYSDLYVTGKVGVGISNPTQKFDVVGHVKISSLHHSTAGWAHVCADTNGELLVCPPTNVFGSVSFATPGTYTWSVPTNVETATFKVWGGAGGGGAGGSSGLITGAGGAGGGGGGYYTTTIPVTSGETLTITVGSGGARGARGANGAAGNAGGTGTITKVVRSNGSIIALGNGGTGGAGGGVPTYSGTILTGLPPAAAHGVGGTYSGIGGGGFTFNAQDPTTGTTTNANSYSCGSNGAADGGGIAFLDADNCESPYSGSDTGVLIPNAGAASVSGSGGGGGTGITYFLANTASGLSSAGANGKVTITW